ncbi:MAG: LapD/MoxY N-terminal periplasmic domain-containing protein [Campylobacterota bacterium]|nr:LapD/MoxY N-terminal periplasmic domain-containing protein [Campylobacterota bacterium]
MTLFKQIALILSILLIIILATVLNLNFKAANTSVQERLYEDAKNTASSLSLSLGSANGDISMMSTMINANFDSGTYSYISLHDVDNLLLYERKEEGEPLDVPEWFLSLVSMSAPVASANVSAGWSQVGILKVQGDVSYAYNALYTILKDLLISFSLIAFIGLVALNLLLAVILKPLKEVQRQAEAVIRNEFILQKNIPYTSEFKDVVLGMNTMVSKVKAMFDKGNRELKRQKELEYIDPATKLRNRKYIIDKLPEYLKIDAVSKNGINMLISLSGAIEANEILGRTKTDELFNDIAEIFTSETEGYESAIIARMNGTEFSILIPDCQSLHALVVAEAILGNSRLMIKNYELNAEETFLSIGLYEYNYKESIGELLSHSDNALAQAKFKDYHIHLSKAEDTVEVMGKNAWREILLNAMKNSSFSFTPWPVVDAKNRKLIHNVLSLTIEVDKSTSYSYGQFMASANQIGLSNDIYREVLTTLFKSPNPALNYSTYSLRLPYEFLLLNNTYDEMKKLFARYALLLPFRLIIEMPDKLVHQNSELIKDYKNLFEKYKVDMGIFEFIGESHDYQYLQDLRPVYIKGEPNYFISQNEQSLSALRLITDSIGISLIATGVMDEKTLKELESKEIYIVQGKVTDTIKP